MTDGVPRYLMCPECGRRYEIIEDAEGGHFICFGRKISLKFHLRFQCEGGNHYNCPPDYPFFDIDERLIKRGDLHVKDFAGMRD